MSSRLIIGDFNVLRRRCLSITWGNKNAIMSSFKAIIIFVFSRFYGCDLVQWTSQKYDPPSI